jgi:CDP-diacylglycerol--glycerol-3-phosphate 3-phosphatidyltransferase
VKITANIVTAGRIVLLPMPCALMLYGGASAQWVAFAWLTILGATDFVDGYMARKEGPTRLGGLLDTAADKMFVAAVTLSLMGIGAIPFWAVCAILSREFLMTALRSSLALRQESIRTSKLAKLKTIYQMGGFGTIFLTLALTRTQLVAASLAIAAGFGITWFGYRARRPRAPFWVLPVFGIFVWIALSGWFMSARACAMIQLCIIVAITWASGVDYIAGSIRVFREKGIDERDWARMLWVFAHSAVVLLAGIYPQLILPVLISMSFELALGGIDMIVAADEQYAGVSPFLTTGLGALALVALGYGSAAGLWHLDVMVFAFILAGLSGVVCSATFFKWRHLFRRALLHPAAMRAGDQFAMRLVPESLKRR